jgi:hypothetical protein
MIFLSTPQIEPNSPRARGFSFEELTHLMNECVTQHIVGIIDTCHAGAVNLPESTWKKSSNDLTARTFPKGSSG